MLIVISGGSTTAEFLISTMVDEGHRIVVIEKDRETIEHLSEALPPQVLIVEGDGCDSSVQLDAGVDEADLFVALMGHDDANLVACEIAMVNFDVPRCIANVNSPKNEQIFEKVGIEPVSSTEIIARMIDEEATIGNIRTIFSLYEGDIVMATLKLPKNMKHKKGVAVRDIPETRDVAIIGVIRDDDIEMLQKDDILMPGETIITALKSDVEDTFRAAVKKL